MRPAVLPSPAEQTRYRHATSHPAKPHTTIFLLLILAIQLLGYFALPDLWRQAPETRIATNDTPQHLKRCMCE